MGGEFLMMNNLAAYPTLREDRTSERQTHKNGFVQGQADPGRSSQSGVFSAYSDTSCLIKSPPLLDSHNES